MPRRWFSIPCLDFQSILARTGKLLTGVVRNIYTSKSETLELTPLGFYIDAILFPSPRFAEFEKPIGGNRLLLGPFCGKPACQYISVAPGKAKGACADAYTQRKTLVVPEVDLYPGHIACDGETKSEIVVPLIYSRLSESVVLGVLDLDCLAVNAFNKEDKEGLERIAQLVVKSCDW